VAELASQTGFLNVQGAPIYYEVAGRDNRPALLFLHAGIADSSMWDEQFSAFADQYRVIRYDLRGYGQSQFPGGAFAHYEDPAELLRFLGVKKAHVIAISFGSKVAVDFALIHHQMVATLVLVAPGVGSTKPSEQVRRFNEEEDALLERGDLQGATELNVRFWVVGPKRSPEQVKPEVRERVYAMQYHAFTIPIPEGAEELELEPPALRRLAEIQVPTLVIVGDCDLPEKIEFARQLATEIPLAQLEIFEDVAHMVSMEKPQEFNDSVRNFLNNLA
jgi:3-oxoadipate enol-lactonase